MSDISSLVIKDLEVKEDTLSLYKAVKDNPKDKIEVEIGDSKDATVFQPQAKIQRWNNEVNFSLRYKDDQVTKGKTIEPEVLTESSTLVWRKDKREVHIYEKPEVGEDGGLEIEVVLKEKPISNVIEFSIETKGLVFCYQPALSSEETEQGMERPENAVDSYAVYHKERHGNYSDKEYRTGKFCHIYRPLIIDTSGNTIWGKLNIDEQKKLLTITVDQKFLDEALYPIVIDPTFGYTSVGASMQSVNTKLGGSEVPTVEASGTITSMSAYCRSASGTYNLQLGVYEMGVSETGSKTLVTNTSSISVNTSVGWRSSDVSSAFSPGGKIVVCQASNSNIKVYLDSGVGFSNYYYASNTFGTWPNPKTFTKYSNYQFSIYATYTEAASSGTNMQINIGDTWKDVTNLQINIGDTWKNVTKVQINVGDTWKTVF